MPSTEEVFEAIRPVEDPEIGLSIVDLGLVYSASVQEDGKVEVEMTLTSPFCPVGPALEEGVRTAVESLGDVTSCQTKIVWNPPWDPQTMASDYAKDVLGIW